MKLALILTTLALAVSSAVAIDCSCYNKCGRESRHCYQQLDHKQRECRNRCHRDWGCYRRCVNDWVHHCNSKRNQCLRHCNDGHHDRCYQEVLEPINIMPDQIEDE